MNQSSLINKFGNPLTHQTAFENEWMQLWNLPSDMKFKLPVLPSKLYTNKLIKQPLIDAFACIIAKNQTINTWDGCFEPRLQRGSDRISLHAFGLAIDINALTNKQGTNGNMNQDIINCFEQQGFIWGGRFGGNRIDPMHFEFLKF